MRKYTMYATGEILLVVVGILIALQINNWNEERKIRSFEKEILSQIKANLNKDKLSLIAIKTSCSEAVVATEKLLDKALTSSYPDSLPYWLGQVVQFDRFMPLSNAYEVLKSKGIDLISNKQLRFLLGTYYDDQAPHVVKAVGDIEHTFMINWLPAVREYVLDLQFKSYLQLTDYKSITESGVLGKLLILDKDNFRGTVGHVTEGITLIDEILQLIHQSLEDK